jgi:hypothetical protein
VDGEEYTNEESSIADCVSTNKSWYYDRDETVLYMHIDGGEDPRLHHVIVGITIGLSNKSKHINDGYYRPCIAGGFSIEKSVDPLEFGVVRFSGTKNVSILNEDGYFDNFMDNIVYGQPACVKYGIDDMDGTEMSYADYRQIMKLYIEKFTLNWTRCQMVLVDYRKLFSRKLPIRFFNKDGLSVPEGFECRETDPAHLGACIQCRGRVHERRRIGTPCQLHVQAGRRHGPHEWNQVH